MTENYDVLIVGSGAAGLYCALHLDPGLKVLQICKKELKLSNSSLAQGGIAATKSGQEIARQVMADEA